MTVGAKIGNDIESKRVVGTAWNDAPIRNKAPVTRERNMSELAALRRAGYHPEWFDDPYYPEDLEAAQRQVNVWYQTECPQARSG